MCASTFISKFCIKKIIKFYINAKICGSGFLKKSLPPAAFYGSFLSA